MTKKLIIAMLLMGLLLSPNLIAEETETTTDEDAIQKQDPPNRPMDGQGKRRGRKNPQARFGKLLKQLKAAYVAEDMEKIGQVIEKMEKAQKKMQKMRKARQGKGLRGQEFYGHGQGQGFHGKGKGFHGGGHGFGQGQGRGQGQCGARGFRQGGYGQCGQGGYGQRGGMGYGGYGRGQGRRQMGCRCCNPRPMRKLDPDWDW